MRKGNNPENDPLYDALWNDDALLKMTSGFNETLEHMAKDDPTMMGEFQKFQANISESIKDFCIASSIHNLV